MNKTILTGKKALIVGIANNNSIAYGCARRLRTLVDIEDVGAMVVFLASNYAKNSTGDTIYIDSGYHIVS